MPMPTGAVRGNKLKVFGGCFDGKNREIVAAPSRKAAAETIGISLYYFNEMASVTGNDEEVRVAMSAPGKAFSRRIDDRTGPWREGKQVGR